MSEITRKRRSPQEIMEAKQAELDRAKAKAAIEGMMANPLIQNLSTKIQEVNKAKAEASKGFSGNIGTRFDVRINSHQAWITEVNAERELANAQIALANYLAPLYRDIRISAATDLSNGMSEDEVSANIQTAMDEVLRGASVFFENVRTATEVYENAQDTRKQYIASKKAGASQPQEQASSSN